MALLLELLVMLPLLLHQIVEHRGTVLDDVVPKIVTVYFVEEGRLPAQVVVGDGDTVGLSERVLEPAQDEHEGVAGVPHDDLGEHDLESVGVQVGVEYPPVIVHPGRLDVLRVLDKQGDLEIDGLVQAHAWPRTDLDRDEGVLYADVGVDLQQAVFVGEGEIYLAHFVPDALDSGLQDLLGHLAVSVPIVANFNHFNRAPRYTIQ